MANTSKYSIEYRNKDGELIHQLTPYATNVSWEWNRHGGCGRAKITLQMEYRKFTFATMDDIQIRIGVENKPTEQITNGDFKLWTAGDASAPDDWELSGAAAAVAKESTITKKGAYSAKITRNGANCYLRHTLSTRSLAFWMGRTITFGEWVYATVADRARISIHEGSVGYAFSDYHTGDSTWQWLTVTKTISGAATYIQFKTFVDSGDTSAYFDGASVIYKSTAPSSKLVYRGWIANVTPITSGGDADKITLDIRGYYDLLKFIIVQDSGTTKTYSSSLISVIVDSIVDTFITPNSSITKGTIDASSFTADTLEFKNTVYDALQTCYDLVGNVDYGVDENLVFFWRDESTTVTHKFIVGDNVKSLKRKTIFDKLVNRIYLEGGLVAGAKYLRTASTADSITTYYLAEKILSNSAIVTSTVADQYLDTILGANNAPSNEITIEIPETSLRLEDTLPIGKVSVYDSDHDIASASGGVWGVISPAGGSGFVWGTVANSGSGKIWGGGSGTFQSQIDNIKYFLSNTKGKFNIMISTANTNNDLAARMNQIENKLESIRQRS